MFFFFLFDILIDLRLFAGYDNRPYYKDSKPYWKNNDSNYCQCVRISLGKVIDFTVPEIKLNFDIFFWADTWGA